MNDKIEHHISINETSEKKILIIDDTPTLTIRNYSVEDAINRADVLNEGIILARAHWNKSTYSARRERRKKKLLMSSKN